MPAAMIELECSTCGKTFERPLRVHKAYKKKAGWNVYCSQDCRDNRAGRSGPKMIELTCGNCGKTFQRRAAYDKLRRKDGYKNTYCTRGCANEAHRDTYSPFRRALKAARNSKHAKKGFDLTLEYLKELWERQDEKCALTGWDIVLPHSTYDLPAGIWINRGYRNASLDRIDSNGGYTIGNVRWVALIANVMRSNYSDAQLLQTCQALLDHAKAKLDT